MTAPLVSRRSLLGWLAALPLAAAAPKLAPAVAKVETALAGALVDFGLWTEYAAYHLVRAYDIQWQVANVEHAVAKELPPGLQWKVEAP
jgi:hypothetical protein